MTTIYPVVSVIVPVYNSGPYLDDCIKSIVNQSYRPIEIILVNDGSTDRSFEIITGYSMRDDRIVVISQPNRGVSAARNAGLSVAKGEYILFVDSDDTIRNDAVEILCRQAILTGTEIVLGDMLSFYPDGKQIPTFQRSTKYSKPPLLSGEQCFVQLVETKTFPPSSCIYFTKRSFILKRRLFFEEGIVHEDELWCIKALVCAQQVSVMDFFYYFYRVRRGSIMRSDNRKYRIYSFFRVAKALEEFAAGLKERQEFVQAIGFVYVRIFYNYFLICQLLHEIKEYTNEYKAYFERLLNEIYPTLSQFQQQACCNYFHNGNRFLLNA